MTDRTITAMYTDRAEAERAKAQLIAAGYERVDVHEQDDAVGATAFAGESFMDKMKAFFGGHEDTHLYHEGLRRGHYLLTAKVDVLEETRAAEILEASNAVDFDRTQARWQEEGWARPEPGPAADRVGGTAGFATTDAGPLLQPLDRPTDTLSLERDRARGTEEEVIPIVEERLSVGKREVERGGVRVRSYVVETPVHEEVRLREEHVSVERRPVDRPAGPADTTFQDRELELTETAEEAVIAKDAVVREELVLRKESGERVQRIDDTVRRTEVEVDDTTDGARREADLVAERRT